MVEAIDYFLPVSHSVEKGMIECFVSIPWFLEEYAYDSVFGKVYSISHVVVDHERDMFLMTDMRFWELLF